MNEEEKLNLLCHKMVEIFKNETGMTALGAMSINIAMIIYACSQNKDQQEIILASFHNNIKEKLQILTARGGDPEKIRDITLKMRLI